MVLSVTALLSACSNNDDDVVPVPPPSDGSKLTLEGGGGTGAPNSVYVDFSANKPTSVPRISWNLGFYAGADFRVILNYVTATSAAALNKTDIAQVGLADTVGVRLALGQGEGTLSIVDDVYGDLSKTVIAAVSATEAENKVYLVKPETANLNDPSTWYKIKVARNSDGYKLQYARLSETNIRTADIGKDAAFNFTFFSFEPNKTVSVEPKKAEWDIQWSYGVYVVNAGPVNLPYLFSDFVYINNLAGVQSAEATEADGFNYSTFAETDLGNAKLVFSGQRDAIGGKWRATSQQGQPSLKTDRFYVVKDAAGNYYKLKFVSFSGNDGGERGRPEIEYKLVKKTA